jgi:hypothetical protein
MLADIGDECVSGLDVGCDSLGTIDARRYLPFIGTGVNAGVGAPIIAERLRDPFHGGTYTDPSSRPEKRSTFCNAKRLKRSFRCVHHGQTGRNGNRARRHAARWIVRSSLC